MRFLLCRDGFPTYHDELSINPDALPINHDELPINHDGLSINHDGLPINHDGLPINHDELSINQDGLSTRHGGLGARRGGPSISPPENTPAQPQTMLAGGANHMVTIGLVVFLFMLAGFIFQREVPEHRAAGRKGLMIFHACIGLASIAAALAIFWNRFGENFVEGTKWFQ